MTAIEQLAAWSLAPHAAFRSDLAQRQARLLLLDVIGCAYAAIETGAVDAVLELTADVGGAEQATVIGRSGKTSVPNAVFANGALIRVLDLNDVMFAEREGKLAVAGHPSENIPAALAVAEAYGLSGRAMLESVVLNYEVYGRLRELIPDAGAWDGASASGMAAAAMAGRLLGLDARRQAHGLALAAARSATPKIVRNGEISAAKSLANAFAMQSGVHSAMLAAKGVTGPLEILDDRKAGLYQVFDPERGLERLWRPIAPAPVILDSHMKSYPSIGTSQTAIAAAIEARARLAGRFDAIESIEVTMADVPAVRRQQGDQARRYPKSREAADHSFAFLVAIALLDGELTHRQFDGERWLHDGAVHGLMDRLTLKVSGELAAQAADSMPGRVKLVLRGGEEIVAECLEPPGRSDGEGLDSRFVEAKFHSVSRGLLDDAARQAIVASVHGLNDVDSLVLLMRQLRTMSSRKES